MKVNTITINGNTLFLMGLTIIVFHFFGLVGVGLVLVIFGLLNIIFNNKS